MGWGRCRGHGEAPAPRGWGFLYRENPQVSGGPMRWSEAKCRPRNQVITGCPSPRSVCLLPLTRASEIIKWIGKPCCGLKTCRVTYAGWAATALREKPDPSAHRQEAQFQTSSEAAGTHALCTSPEDPSRTGGRPSQPAGQGGSGSRRQAARLGPDQDADGHDVPTSRQGQQPRVKEGIMGSAAQGSDRAGQEGCCGG